MGLGFCSVNNHLSLGGVECVLNLTVFRLRRVVRCVRRIATHVGKRDRRRHHGLSGLRRISAGEEVAVWDVRYISGMRTGCISRSSHRPNLLSVSLRQCRLRRFWRRRNPTFRASGSSGVRELVIPKSGRDGETEAGSDVAGCVCVHPGGCPCSGMVWVKSDE